MPDIVSKAKPLHALTATEALDLLRASNVSVEDYALGLLVRVQEREAAVKAWTYLNPKLVLEQAKSLDRISPYKRGPLHGVAVGIKDVMETKGLQLSA